MTFRVDVFTAGPVEKVEPLEDLLDWHCQWACRQAQDVRPGGDIAPMLALLKIGQPIEIAVPRWDTPDGKDEADRWFKARLAERQADAYAEVMACWTVEIPEDHDPAMIARIQREGTAAFPDLRREAISVIVGNRQRCLCATLRVTRDGGGRIVEVSHDRTADQHQMAGRFVDMLATRH